MTEQVQQQQYGVKETKEVLDFMLAGTKAGFDVMADGKVGVEDLGIILALVPTVGPAFDQIALVPKELGDLSTEEAAELLAHVGAKLALPGAKAQIIVNRSLKMAHKIYEIIVEAKAMKAELAAVPAPAGA